VGEDGRVSVRKVAIYRDFGTSAELRDGLSGGERLVISPPAELSDGGKIKVSGEKTS
jgi:HlyD family secretion protein